MSLTITQNPTTTYSPVVENKHSEPKSGEAKVDKKGRNILSQCYFSPVTGTTAKICRVALWTGTGAVVGAPAGGAVGAGLGAGIGFCIGVATIL